MRYDSILSGYTRFSFRHGLWTRRVYRRGVGPAVIIIHEMPGLHPLVVRFADRVALAGMTVFCPSLCGVAGRPADHPLSRFTILYGVCVRREFNSWAAGRSSPIVDWLRALARRAFQECGGRGVGAVGMCFTGGFALAMMTEPSVVAPVLSQPSLPLAGKNSPKASGIDASSEEVTCAKRRFGDENLSMVGLRFFGDPLVPDGRFETYRREFGEHFEAIELDPKTAAPGGLKRPHSVLTINLRDEGPTKAAEQRVIEFLRERTSVAPPNRLDKAAP